MSFFNNILLKTSTSMCITQTFVDTLESLTNWLDASSLKTISAVGSTKSFSSLSLPMLLVIAEIATLFCLFAYNAYADHKKKNLYIVE